MCEESEEIKGNVQTLQVFGKPQHSHTGVGGQRPTFCMPQGQKWHMHQGPHAQTPGHQPEGRPGTDGLSLERRMKEVPSGKGMGTLTVSKANIKDCCQVCTKTKGRKRQCCFSYPPCLFTPSFGLSAFCSCLEARPATESVTSSDHREATVAPRPRYCAEPTRTQSWKPGEMHSQPSLSQPVCSNALFSWIP